MKRITMVEFRSHSAGILGRLARGERLLLTHRGHPVATLEPVAAAGGDVPESDPIYRLDDFSFESPGDGLSNEEIDRLVYGDADQSARVAESE